MPIKRSLVNTGYLKERDPYPVSMPVFYTDELLDEHVLDASVYDLAYSSTHGNYLPYLFVGYSKTDKQDVGTWYFANARMHEELEMVIKEDVKEEMQYIYGQIHFGSELKNGKLEFRRLILYGEISANEQARQEALNKLVSVINPRDIEDELHIHLVEGVKWHYVWNKTDKQLQRIK